jgi:hypothetical protein
VANFCIGWAYARYDERDAIVGTSKDIKKCFTSWRKAEKAFKRMTVGHDWDDSDRQPLLCKRGKYGRCESIFQRPRSRKKNQKVSARTKRRGDYIPF